MRINGGRARQVGASGGIFGVIGALLAFLWCAPPPRDSTLVCDHSVMPTVMRAIAARVQPSCQAERGRLPTRQRTP